MPVEQSPPLQPMVNLETEDLKLLNEAVTDAYALQQVLQTYYKYESFRTLNHDRRWNNNDSLYWGWVPPKTWEGTSVARASLGMPLVFDQIMSALPIINPALFANGDEDWFSVDAELGEDPKTGRDIKGALMYALEHSREPSGLTAYADIQLAVHEVLQYGNGGVYIEFDPTIGLPRPQWIDIRDIYIDPSCATPSVDDARSIIWRKTLSLDDLETLKQKDPRIKLPSRAVLAYLSRNIPLSNADVSKQYAEALRGVQFHPASQDFSPIPNERKVELLILYSKSRVIWVLNRVWVALNIENVYGFAPFAIAPCYIVPGRFYASCLADMNEGNQRYAEALMNGHLDEVSLHLHPPRTYKNSGFMTPSQQRWRPGGLFPVSDKDDMQVLMPNGPLLNVFPEIQFIHMLAQQRTGVNSMMQAVPQPGNINRTLGGVQAQAGGAATRLAYIIKNIEDYLIVPMLTKMYAMIRFHTSPESYVPSRGERGRTTFVSGRSFQQPVRFKISAASKVNTQQKLAQTFPFLMQFLVSGPFMSELARVRKTIDFDELLAMLKDATGVGKNYNLVREMTEEEWRARQEPPPEVRAAQEKAQMDSQTRLGMGQLKIQAVQEKVKGDIQRELIKKQSDPQQQQAELQMKLMEFGLQRALAEMELTQAQQKMLIDAARDRQKLEVEQQKAQQQMQLEAMRGRQQAQLGYLDFVTNMRQQMMQAHFDAQRAQTEAALQQRRAAQAAQVDDEQTRAKIGLARTTRAPAEGRGGKTAARAETKR